MPILGLSLLWSALAPLPAIAQQPAPKVTEEQIQTAIKRAVDYLRGDVQRLDGGESALVTMALLKSGQSPDTPAIQAGIGRIRAHVANGVYKAGTNHIYEAGVSLMALANADAKTYKPEIEAIANYIITMQHPGGEWDYPTSPDGGGDTSITQYAILGLWEAVRSDVVVPKKVWDKAASWHVTRQAKNGSFAYHPPAPSPDGVTLNSNGTHTMTVAGTASLLVTRLHLYPGASDPDEGRSAAKKRGAGGKKFGLLEPVSAQPEEPNEDSPAGVPKPVADPGYRPTTRLSAIDKAIAKGRDWLSDNFSIAPSTKNSAQGNGFQPTVSWDLYYLYGIERLTALAGIKEINGIDWYAAGAAHLVATQNAGTWRDQSGSAPSTAFGVMFLGKATEKMLGRKPVVQKPRFGGGLLIGGRGLPENLSTLQVDQGAVRVRKLKGPVDELLAELENAQSRQVESAQAALVETIATEDPEALIGQAARLLKLARDKRVEVRRTVFWALGRTNDLRVVPTLIAGLNDADGGCAVEARNALRFISKRIDVHEPPDEPTAAQTASAISYWKKWYLSVRPYDERDDLGESPPK